MRELEAQSGFDKRTIAYYIQEGLLPKVGRRGRRTRYPQEFLDRLMLIRRVRDLQDAGQLRAVTLSEIRSVIAGQSAEQTRTASQEDVSPSSLRDLFAEPDFDTSDSSVAAEEIAPFALQHSEMMVAGFEEPTVDEHSMRSSLGRRREAMAARQMPEAPRRSVIEGSPPDRSSTPSDSRIRDLLQEIKRRASAAAAQSGEQTSERLTRVPVSEEIMLSVRDIPEEDAHLVEELAELLRRVGNLD